MKQFLKFLTVAVILTACVVSVFGSTPAVLIAAPPAIVLDAQQMVWLRSLKEEYEAIDTWLSEAEDLSSFVESGQTLIFPEAGADPLVYVNRTTDVDNVEPAETTNEVPLDVYDSQNYKIRNIYLHALPFDKVQYYTKKSADAIVKKEIENAAYSFAASSAGNKRIVIPSTGAVRGIYKMLTLDDIVTLARACDSQEFPSAGRNLVLTSDMWWDLVQTNQILKGQLERQTQNGIIKPLIVEYYGFKIHKSEQKLNIGFDTTNTVLAKAPQGAVIAGNVVPTGFVFIKSAVFRASGKFLMFKKDLLQNTEGRAHEFGFQHRFKADYQMRDQRYSALLYLAKT